MKVIYSLLLLAPCLLALMISCCEYFLINVKLTLLGILFQLKQFLYPFKKMMFNR